MNPPTMNHPFDEAIALQPHPSQPGSYSGKTHPAWMNMVGPFGGITSAAMINAVLQHPALLGEPIAMTINFCAAVGDGPYELEAVPVRTNRSTQHWTMQLSQNSQTVVTGTAVTAARKSTWSTQDEAMPTVAKAKDCAQAAHPLPWMQRYDTRIITGPLPAVWDGTQASSLSQLWVRDARQRALDMPALAALCDVFFPRVYVRRAVLVPIGTVSLTTYFHCDAAQLAGMQASFDSSEEGARECADHVLGQARGLNFRNGFFDQTALLWASSGELLASTHQTVYYKE